MRFAIKTRPERQTWEEIRDAWIAADEIPLFESAWNWDHFYPPDRRPERPEPRASGRCWPRWRRRPGGSGSAPGHRHDLPAPRGARQHGGDRDIISGGPAGTGPRRRLEPDGVRRLRHRHCRRCAERFDRFDEGVEAMIRLLEPDTHDASTASYVPAHRRQLRAEAGAAAASAGHHRRDCGPRRGPCAPWRAGPSSGTPSPSSPQQSAELKEVLAGHCAGVGRDPERDHLLGSTCASTPAERPAEPVGGGRPPPTREDAAADLIDPWASPLHAEARFPSSRWPRRSGRWLRYPCTVRNTTAAWHRADLERPGWRNRNTPEAATAYAGPCRRTSLTSREAVPRRPRPPASRRPARALCRDHGGSSSARRRIRGRRGRHADRPRQAGCRGLRRCGLGRLGRRGLLEVHADQVALLGQQLIEVLVDIVLADRFRGQVQVLDLLELARPRVLGVVEVLLADGIRRGQRRLGRRRFRGAGRRATGLDSSGSNGPRAGSWSGAGS